MKFDDFFGWRRISSTPNLTNHQPRNGTSPTACRGWEKCREWKEAQGMNSLPGNDHAAVSKFRTEGVHDWQADEGQTDATCIAAAIDANTEATLALAHEQRTATLVNVVRMYADLGMAEHATGIIDAITDRLGGYDHE